MQIHMTAHTHTYKQTWPEWSKQFAGNVIKLEATRLCTFFYARTNACNTFMMLFKQNNEHVQTYWHIHAYRCMCVLWSWVTERSGRQPKTSVTVFIFFFFLWLFIYLDLYLLVRHYLIFVSNWFLIKTFCV